MNFYDKKILFSALHSGLELGKKLDKLIAFPPIDIFPNPIQGKGKMSQGIRF